MSPVVGRVGGRAADERASGRASGAVRAVLVSRQCGQVVVTDPSRACRSCGGVSSI